MCPIRETAGRGRGQLLRSAMNEYRELGAGMHPEKRRRKRGGRRCRTVQKTALILLGIGLICGAAVCLNGMPLRRGGRSGRSTTTAADASLQSALPLSAEEQAKQEREEAVEAVIASYQNLGIVEVEGYLNIHNTGAQGSDIIGKLYNGSACEILDQTGDGWLHIRSGGIEGYVHPDYVKTGEEARKRARQEVKERAIIQADKLYIRSEPTVESEAVFTALKNERYEVEGQQAGWIKLKSGWISDKYAEIRLSLNEARRLDLREMVLNMYDRLGVSEVDSYLNIRAEAKEDGAIIGKLTSKAGCDILGTEGEWLKIHSGDITGYVKAEYIATGQQAKDLAMQYASLMAIVTTDVLNARSEPRESSKIWTQISNSERYPVLEQSDGWVKIELEEEQSCYVKSEFVDVRYALNEAVRFSPAEEAAQASLSRRQKLINYAMQFLGNPYVWGGTSLTRGCDCSGFSMRIMEQFGVSLPHYSGSQSQMGRKVSSAEIRPGDLVFYSNSGGRINHVGIYIGNGQLIHAASRRSGIKISNWTYRRPATIRNVLGD